MKVGALLLVIVGVMSVAAGQTTAEVIPKLEGRDGRVYANVKVREITRNYIVAHWDGGVGMIMVHDLTDESRKALGFPTSTELVQKAEADRLERARKKKQEAEQQRIYAEQQRAKGFVSYDGKWMSPAERTKAVARAREQAYEDKARRIVVAKSKPDAVYRVLQAMPLGSLCVMAERGRFSGNLFFTGECFFLVGATDRIAADGDKYRDDLHWAGTYTYTTVAGARRTVNSYLTNQDLACKLVRLKFGLHDKPVTAKPVVEEGPKSGTVTGTKKEIGSGSGFFITKDGYLITNHHVVARATTIRVRTEKSLLDGKLIGTDPKNDIALVKVEGKFTPVGFNSRRSARLGETVFTIGYPMPTVQGFSPKVTKGVVSSLTGVQDDVRMYQFDAPVQPGNSGGALADSQGCIVGVVTGRLSDAFTVRRTGSVPQNVNYAIKKAYILAFLDAHPSVARKVRTTADGPRLSFEDAVAKVLRSSVLVIAQ